MQASVKITGMEVFKDLRSMGPEGKRAIEATLKKCMLGGRKIIVRETAAVFNTPEEAINKTMRATVNVSGNVFKAEITAKGKNMPLFAFSGLPKSPYTGGPLPVGASAAILHQRRYEMQDPEHPGQHAFVAEMENAHIGIFKRKGKFGRKPRKSPLKQGKISLSSRIDKLEKIREVQGPSIPSMIGNNKVLPAVIAGMERLLLETGQKEFKSAVRRIFKGWAAGKT